MIDHDNDGFIDKDDLKDMLASLGIVKQSNISDKVLRTKSNG